MSSQPGTLYLVATPIGNLEDITIRALRLLREADLIAAEDTRRTRKLLAFYEIHRPLVSYHEHNMRGRGPRLLRELLAGKTVALVTDAGTPGISDPGQDLVRESIARDIRVSIAPGPSAVTAALTVSGLPQLNPFLFLGFPPSRSAGRQTFFTRYASIRDTLVLFESPKRLGASLRDMRKIWGNRQVAVVREITKVHEEIFRGDLEEALLHWPGEALGEVTLVVAGASGESVAAGESLPEHLRRCLSTDPRPLGEIAAEVAQSLGISKRLVYQQGLKIKRELSSR
jgi:16S rRNA (cytidine1402-2'-O)-methyltransferase